MASIQVTPELREWLTRRREALGVSQDAMHVPGYRVSRSTIQNIESGRVERIRAGSIIAVFVNLDVTPAELTRAGFTQLARMLEHEQRSFVNQASQSFKARLR